MSTGRLGAGDTAIQPTILDAKGDLIVATAADTPARLAVGSANQVLTVDSSTATGLKWATPASDTNGFVLIKTATFSGVADTGTTFDDVFSSTYSHYALYIYATTSAGAPDLQLQLRYAGPTTQTTNYFTITDKINQSPTSTISYTGTSSQFRITSNGVGGTNQGSAGIVNIFYPNEGSIVPQFTSETVGYGPGEWNSSVGYQATARNYTGFLMKLSSGNISGTVSVYGVAK